MLVQLETRALGLDAALLDLSLSGADPEGVCMMVQKERKHKHM